MFYRPKKKYQLSYQAKALVALSIILFLPFVVPKAELTAALAQALDVAPQALDIPDIDSQIGLMHTLFALEDIYGLTISETDGEVCLKISKDKGKAAEELLQMLTAWQEQAAKLTTEEISRRQTKNRLTRTQKTPLAMSYYPQLRAFLIWIYHSHTNHFKIIPRPANHLSVRIIALA